MMMIGGMTMKLRTSATHGHARVAVACVRVLLIGLLLAPSAIAAQGTDPLAVVQAYEDAINAGNVEGAMALLADDALISTLHSLSYQGKDQIESFLRIAVAGKIHFEVIGKRHVVGNTVTWIETITFGGRQYRARSEALVQAGQITSIRSSAAAAGLPLTGGDSSRGAPWLLAVSGLGIFGIGFAVRRRYVKAREGSRSSACGKGR
jgi:ketosteroid isomerase-like protein